MTIVIYSVLTTISQYTRIYSFHNTRRNVLSLYLSINGNMFIVHKTQTNYNLKWGKERWKQHECQKWCETRLTAGRLHTLPSCSNCAGCTRPTQWKSTLINSNTKHQLSTTTLWYLHFTTVTYNRGISPSCTGWF